MKNISDNCEVTETPEPEPAITDRDNVPDILSRKATAKYLGICESTLDRLTIPKTRIGRRVMYKRDVLKKWVDGKTERAKRGKA